VWGSLLVCCLSRKIFAELQGSNILKLAFIKKIGSATNAHFFVFEIPNIIGFLIIKWCANTALPKNKIKMSRNTILATDKNGNEITVEQVEKWIVDKEKTKLAELVYDRLYGRYLKPFDFKNSDYEKNYKNGFAIMANCCLLIETYISFKEPDLKSTYKNSERCFGIFFTTEDRFKDFSNGGLSATEYKNLEFGIYRNNKGIPKEFYSDVRCGILHSGETRNNWKIVRSGDFFDEDNRRINASKFLNQLKYSISDFKKELKIENFDTSDMWKTYIAKLEYIISKA
jgi:hypothetical protein